MSYGVPLTPGELRSIGAQAAGALAGQPEHHPDGDGNCAACKRRGLTHPWPCGPLSVLRDRVTRAERVGIWVEEPAVAR